MAKRMGDRVERCPAVSALQRMIGSKRKIEILFHIDLKDVSRFGHLRRCIDTILESTLSKQLRELVNNRFLSSTSASAMSLRT